MDTRTGVVRRVAASENLILSIQLLSMEHTLALTLDDWGKVRIFNYKTGRAILLTTVDRHSNAFHTNSLLQVLHPQSESGNYTLICRDGWL